MKPVIYVAHPVTGDPLGNCIKAEAWLKWLTAADPTRIYIAPWVAEVRAHLDEVCTPEFYDRVLSDDEEVVARLDGILLCGERRSAGMTRELAASALAGCVIFNLLEYATVAAAAADCAEYWDSGTHFMNEHRVNNHWRNR